MIITSGFGACGKDYLSRRADLSFIVSYHWKSSSHLKEAIRLLLSARTNNVGKGAVAKAEDSPAVLEYGEYRRIRIIIASNPNTPPAVLSYLAASNQSDAGILERVAENPRTPDCTLVLLAHSPFPLVRAAVAENVNATPDILTVLGTDHDADVRYSLAENPHLPPEFLAGFAEDLNPYVRHRAAATLARIDGGMVVEGIFQKRKRAEDEQAVL